MEPPKANHKDVLFAKGFLRGMGLSEVYAEIIADRIMVPGAKLSPEDAEWLRLVKQGAGMINSALGGS